MKRHFIKEVSIWWLHEKKKKSQCNKETNWITISQYQEIRKEIILLTVPIELFHVIYFQDESYLVTIINVIAQEWNTNLCVWVLLIFFHYLSNR